MKSHIGVTRFSPPGVSTASICAGPRKSKATKSERASTSSWRTIDIDRFVPQADVDERYLDTPYYLAPADRVAQEAFAVIREAMDTGPNSKKL